MKVFQIEIKRFRSILNLVLPIRLENNQITICGANNTGKTNVLKALNLFFNPDEYTVNDDSPNHKYYGSRGGKSYPEITLKFTDGEIEYHIKRTFGNTGILGTRGIKKLKRKSVKMSNEEVEKFVKQTTFFLIPSINISFPELINKLIDDVYDLEYEKTRFSGLKQQLKESFDLYIKGIIDVLNQLALEINLTFDEFNPNWSVGFEYTSDIKRFRDLISEDIDFYLNDKSNRNIEGKGSGLQRLGYILLHSRIIHKLTKKNVILAIDEPDVYLHLGLQKKLKNHLSELSEKCQVIITSHSPVFIDSYKLDNVFLLDLQIGGQVTYQRTGKTFHPLNTILVDLYEHDGLQKIQKYLGIEPEDYELLDYYNILVEGNSDKIYIEETCRYFGIELAKVIPAHGCTKIEKYLEFYDSFYSGRDFKPKIKVLFDNDEAGREEYRKIFKKVSKNFKFIEVKLEFVPTCFGDVPNLKEVVANTVKSNFEIEDFIYPEILFESISHLLKKQKFKQVNINTLNKRLQAPAFKEKGILFNIDLLKNEKNPNSGQQINLSSEQVKQGIANFYKINGNISLSTQVDNLNLKYPAVKMFLQRIMDYGQF